MKHLRTFDRFSLLKEEFDANYGPGRADYPGNVTDETYNIEDEITHSNGIEARVYSNGIIEFCKDGKRLTAYKFSSPSDRKGGFEKIKSFFNETEGENIDEFDIFNDSGIQYSGTILKAYTYTSDECGEEGLKTISWRRGY